MVKAVFFDFGGTLDTDGIHWSEKFWDIYQKFNINVNKKEYEYAYVQAEKRIGGDDCTHKSFLNILNLQISYQFDELNKIGLIDKVDEQLVNKMVETCYGDVKKTMNYSRKILKSLSEKKSIGIISNFYGNLKEVCKEFDIDSYITLFIDSVIVGIRKPDPNIYQLAVDSLQCKPEEVIMVGDSYDRDIIPSKNVGMKTVWLKGRSWCNYSDNHSSADYTISSIKEIVSLDLFK